VPSRKPSSLAKLVVDAATRADLDGLKALLKRGADINAQYYYSFARGFVLGFNFQGGYGNGLAGKPYPIFKNYYAGGIGSVRGYEPSSLGPRDAKTGDPIGGSKLRQAPRRNPDEMEGNRAIQDVGFRGPARLWCPHLQCSGHSLCFQSNRGED